MYMRWTRRAASQPILSQIKAGTRVDIRTDRKKKAIFVSTVKHKQTKSATLIFEMKQTARDSAKDSKKISP
jgi:hypothetical protein